MESKVTNIDNRFSLGHVFVSRTTVSDALSRLKRLISLKQFGYLCFMDMRTAYLANHDADYRDIQNRSMFTFSDGITILWYAKLSGNNEVEKVSGKDFMDMVFSLSVQEGYSHYFFGSTPETIEKIQENLINKYPGISILGAVSPLFQPLEAFDIDSLAVEINKQKPTFFWCGLGAPKQERLMALLQPKLDSTICAGVGLAFEYVAGTVRRAPLWMHKNGLEWVYRLYQQPRNIKRIIRPLFWIIREMILVIVRK
jgi:N-acetylglucosaminyldiphosphoundecaprenol N-acetyl-beta-D-mannosaminyltransferase